MAVAFCCPVCRGRLELREKSFCCEQGHCFDQARQGYVNLLRSNRPASHRHGDDRFMVQARQRFLDGGSYSCLLDAVCELLLPGIRDGDCVLDIGCGEGYYTAGLHAACQASEKQASFVGIDISKDALIQAHKRDSSLQLAVASSAALPLPPASCDAALSIFAPLDAEQVQTVLRPGGLLLRVLPLRFHLMGLKRAVYDRPYENPDPEESFGTFRLLQRKEVRKTLSLSSQQEITDLFCMTPYYYKTGRLDQEKLTHLKELETELAFCLLLYEKAGTFASD